MKTTLLATALLFLTVTTAFSQERRAMTTDDGLDMVNVGGAIMSPNGEWVFYSRSELNGREQKGKQVLHDSRRRRRSVPVHR
jgi:hypothetical protein